MFTGVFIASIWLESGEQGYIHGPITFKDCWVHMCPHYLTNLIYIALCLKLTESDLDKE